MTSTMLSNHSLHGSKWNNQFNCLLLNQIQRFNPFGVDTGIFMDNQVKYHGCCCHGSMYCQATTINQGLINMCDKWVIAYKQVFVFHFLIDLIKFPQNSNSARESLFNSLWPRDPIWHLLVWYRSVNTGSGNAPSHYLNQWWLLINRGSVAILWGQFHMNCSR